MNIKITHNWLLEYLETEADPFEIQKYLSLCGPSVEIVTKIDADYVYDIEITTNRVDMASVLGIAQEAQAILPQFGKKAKLKYNPLDSFKFSSVKTLHPQGGHSHGDNAHPEGVHKAKSLNIEIKNKSLCSRFTAIVLANIKIDRSPEFIKQRLNFCGIKSINNVVDISNYLMIALGQPVHVFDYDSIGRDVINHVSTMRMRESKKEEKIITLDGKQIALPGGDIVIEDGVGKLVDLCGIMGGFNSAVNPKTDKVILFIQTYNPQKIRRTSMLTGQRTVAATYFEKGLDEERVEPTTVYGVELLKKYAGARIASDIYDIYPKPYKPSSVSITLDDINRRIGQIIEQRKIAEILTNLGFKYHIATDRSTMVLKVPSWRGKDISIKEDIIEEIARIYGYHNLPNNIQSTVYAKQPKEVEQLFELQSKVKHFLKHLGLNEVMNYSMISRQIIENTGLKVSDHLRLKNTISKEIEYMRRYLLQSLIKNIKDNEGKKENLKLFEIAKGYNPQVKDLPAENYQLAIATNTCLDDLKGIIEALFDELNINDFEINPSKFDIFDKGVQAEITIAKDWLGKFGQLNRLVKEKFKLKSEVFLASFDFEALIKFFKPLSSYIPINPYSEIKLDLTIEQNPKRPFSYIKESAFKTSKLLQKIELIYKFKNKITLRFYFSSPEKNLTEEEAKKELKNIINKLK